MPHPQDNPAPQDPAPQDNAAIPEPKRFARAKFRAWHRGTREADFMIGGFFDKYSSRWTENEMRWFEAILDEDDVDIMAWALGVQTAPPLYEGPLMDAMRRLDYVHVHR